MPEATAPAMYIDSAGRIVPVAPESAQEADALGWLPASPKQIADYRLQQEHGGLASQVATAAESAGSVLTAGLSTAAEKALGVKGIAERREANPISSGVGTAIGLLAPVAAGKLGAFTAPGAFAKAGSAATEAATAATEGMQGAGLLGRMAAGAIQHGAGWATEGALYSLGNVIDEAALGDPNLTAQSALAEVGLGGLLGGAIGGVVGARAGALPAALTAARDVTKSVYGEAKKGLSEAYQAVAGAFGKAAATSEVMIENAITIGALEHAAPGVAKIIEASTPDMAAWAVKNSEKLIAAEKSYPGIQKMLLNGTDPAHASFLLDNFDAMWRDAATRSRVAGEMYRGMDQVVREVNAMMRAAHTEIIPEEMATLMRGPNGANLQAVAERAGTLVDSLKSAAEKMRAEPELYSQSRARHVESLIDGLSRDMPGMQSAEDVFNRLNVLKRTLDDAIPWGQEALSQSFADKQSIGLLKGLRSEVKGVLTDPAVFGVAATRHAALNDAISEWTKLTDKKGLFRKLFMEVGDGGKATISPNKIDVHLGKILRLGGEQGVRVWDRTLQAARDLVEHVGESAKIAPAASFDRAAMDAVIEKSAKQTADARLAASVTRGIREQNPAIPFGNGIAAPLMSAAAHIPGGATIVQTIKSATSVSAAAGVLAHLESLGQKVSDRIDAAVSTLVRGGVKASSIGRGEVAAGIAHYHGMEAAARVAAFNRRKGQVEDLTADPEVFSQRIEDHANGLRTHAPQTAQAMQVASARAAQFLASKIPHAPPGRGPLAPEWQPSDVEMSRWMRYYDAVQNPMSILKQAATGTITPEAIEAVRTVYPDLFAKMQGAVVDKLTDPRADRPPYQSRLGLSAIMGYSLDGSAMPGFLLRTQQSFVRAPPPAQKATPSRADNLQVANRTQTPGQASASRSR